MPEIKIFQDKGREDLKQLQQLIPTLFIGLGGSGKRVLYQLRRLFYEKYGIAALPIMKFIYFDTDVNDLATPDYDKISSNIELSNADIIDATIEQSRFDYMIQNLGALYPHIDKWFNKEHLVQAATTGIQDGAKQIRPLGRLCFHFKYNQLKEQIKNKINFSNEEIQNSINFISNRQNIRPEVDPQRVEIVVIGSLAGGTCAGSFIDVGFLCRSIGAANAAVSGIFFLPSAFFTLAQKKGGFDYERAKANGYASLMELNYYMSPYLDDRNTTTIDFEWDRGAIVSAPAPAYHIAYLLENKNSKGKFDANHVDVFNMAAEFLFLDFNESSFSTSKRSLHSNANVALGSNTYVNFANTNYIQSFPNRFSSFGLSQIRMNIDKIKNASMYLLASRFFDIFLRQNDLRDGWYSNNVWNTFNFTEDLIIERLSRYDEINNYFQDERKAVDEDKENVKGFNSINSLIIDIYNNTKNKSIEQFVLNNIENCNKLIDRSIKSVRKRLAEGDFDGEAIQIIGGHVRQFESELMKNIEDKITDYLFDYKRGGLNYAKEFAKLFDNQLKILLKAFNDYRAQTVVNPNLLTSQDIPEIDLTEISSILEKYKAYLNEANELLPVPPKFRTTAINHFTFRYERTKKQYDDEKIKQTQQLLDRIIKDKRDELIRFIDISYKKKIAEKVKPLLDRLQSFIDEISTKLEHFERSIKYEIEECNKYYESYKKSDLNSRNDDLDIGWSDEDYINNILKNENETNINTILDSIWRISSQKLQEINGDNYRQMFLHSAHLNILNTKQEWKKNADLIFNEVSNKFNIFKIHGSINTALQLFNNKNQDSNNRNNAIKNRIDFSFPRIQQNSSNDLNANLTKIALLGVDNQENDFIQDVLRLDENQVNFASKKFSDDSIIFYQEFVGIPVFAIGETNEYETSYKKLLRDDPSNIFKCHIEMSTDKYFEVMLPSAGEAASRIRKYEPFILGLILNIIEFDESSKKFILHMQDSLGINRKIPLSKSIIKSINQLNDEQIGYLEREAGITGRLINRLTKSLQVEKLQQIEVVLLYLVDQNNKVFHSRTVDNENETILRLNIIEEIVNSLLNKIHRKIYQVREIPDIENILASKDSLDIQAEKNTYINEYKLLRERILSNIDSFSKTISYTDSRINGGFRVLK